MLPAAIQTFSKESISKTISAHGEDRGIDLERRRLEMYKVATKKPEYEIAKSNIDSLAFALDAQRREGARLMEEKRQKEEQSRLEQERKKYQAKVALLDAAQEARFSCKGKSECEKAFSLTQIFLSENADMKIQVATETIIETYNPTDSMKIGLKAIKMPRKGDTAEIILTATCRDEVRESFIDLCDKKLLSIYRAYSKFLQTAIRP